MQITVRFFSYFKDLTGCAETAATVAPGSTIADLVQILMLQFPRFGAMKNSVLIAVGVEYQPRTYVLREHDEVSFFPPVQGG